MVRQLKEQLNGGTDANGDDKIQTYIDSIGNNIRAQIQTVHKYEVKVEYGTSGLVNKVRIIEK